MTGEEANQDEASRKEQHLLKHVNDSGGTIGNITLQRKLNWGDEFWVVRDRLIDRGELEPGRGKGGSVRIVRHVSDTATRTAGEVAKATDAPRVSEDSLYDNVASVLRSSWAKDKRYSDMLLQATAKQGKRSTGGKWTRLDITVATMTTLLYLPSKLLDVITFEVKASDALDVTAVYEALAHRRAATRAYVWLHTPEHYEQENVDEIETEAKRFGIGSSARATLKITRRGMRF